MVGIAVAASLALAAVYPADTVRSVSPLGRYAVENVDLGKESATGNHHVLYLLDEQAKTRVVLMEYVGNADVAWAPDRNAVAVSHDSTRLDANSDTLVFEVAAGKVGRGASLMAALRAALPELDRDLAKHKRLSLGCAVWRDDGGLDCRLQDQPTLDEHVIVSPGGKASVVPKVSTPRTAGPPPVGTKWRTPTRAELSEAWRDRDKDRFAAARADFDGDGRLDEAILVLSESGRFMAIQVTLSGSGETALIGITPQTTTWLPILGWGIAPLPLGTYATACGRGHVECAPGESRQITLKASGVTFFREESAASVFYLPAGEKTFRQTWMSD